MDAKAYEQFRELEESHFWFRGRRSIFFDLIGRTLNGQTASSQTIALARPGLGHPGVRQGQHRVGALDEHAELMVTREQTPFDRGAAPCGHHRP